MNNKKKHRRSAEAQTIIENNNFQKVGAVHRVLSFFACSCAESALRIKTSVVTIVVAWKSYLRDSVAGVYSEAAVGTNNVKKARFALLMSN